MKKRRYMFLVVLNLALTGCANSSSPDVDDTPDDNPDPIVPVKKSFFENSTPGDNKTYPDSLSEFVPTLFSGSSVKKDSSIELADGLINTKYSFNLNSSKKVIASTLEVDLTKVSIATNYSKTGVSTLYSQMNDFKISEGKEVYAIMNADFFATGSGTSVNAYVKNNQIIKDSHNDNGIYDYTNSTADIPASKPMLFGTSGNEARISPIIADKNVENTIKTKFSNLITYVDSNKKAVNLDGSVICNPSTTSDSYNYIIVNDNILMSIQKDWNIVKVKKIKNLSPLINGTVEKISAQKLDGKKTFSDTDDYFYIIVSPSTNIPFSLETEVGYSVTSGDSTWNYYENIIGGRQSLVENGEIASTVKLENSNGAQNTNIPRSGVGVVNKSKVLICCIESLRYGKYSSSDEDGYGVNLPEFAEFMRYIGCYDAMNFDGGGSSQMITKNSILNEEPKVIVRSSDYGTYNLNDGRKVYNSIVVTKK